MCGISARIGEDGSLQPLLTSIKNLEYRGYDSAGVAIRNGSGVEVRKCGGEVAQLESAVAAGMTDGSIGIGHTRWSTHGPPTDANAHPHTDCHGRIAVVHNGIIENHAALREGLAGRGHEFTSDTDTEVIPHLIEERLEDGHDPETAFRSAVDQLEGSYAVAMVLEDEPAIYAARSGSPLVVGVGDSEHFLASDVPAFLEFTDRVVYLEDDDVVVLTTDGYRVSTGRTTGSPLPSVTR